MSGPSTGEDKITRRGTVLGSATAVLFSRTFYWFAKGTAISLAPSAALLAPLRAKSAAAIGDVVRLALPELEDPESIVMQLLTDMGLSRDSAVRASRVEMSNRINVAVRLDFESGRIVNVAGWRLSVTEARLCALAAKYVS